MSDNVDPPVEKWFFLYLLKNLVVYILILTPISVIIAIFLGNGESNSIKFAALIGAVVGTVMAILDAIGKSFKSWHKKASWRKRIPFYFCLAVFLYYLIPRSIAAITFSDVHEPSLSSDFTALDKMLPSQMGKASRVRAGLPHNYSDKVAFHRALWLSNFYSYDGYLFERQTHVASERFKQVTKTVLSSAESYRPYSGPKLCGGYHADYMFTIDDKGEQFHFMVCFGCHEVLIYSPKGECMVDLTRPAYDKLKDVWFEEFK